MIYEHILLADFTESLRLSDEGDTFGNEMNLKLDRQIASGEDLHKGETLQKIYKEERVSPELFFKSGHKTLFAQASSKTLRWAINTFRVSRERSFAIQFKGEEGQDVGGLYYDFMTSITDELMSNRLNLFLPTGNNVENIGDERETWLLNPNMILTPADYIGLGKEFGTGGMGSGGVGGGGGIGAVVAVDHQGGSSSAASSADEITNNMTTPYASGTEAEAQTAVIKGYIKPPLNKIRHCPLFQYYFLGRVMGMHLRRGDVFPVCLTQQFWKHMVNEELTFQDFQAADNHGSKFLTNLLKSQTRDEFDCVYSTDYRFVFNNALGQRVPLVPNGENITLTFENRHEFVESVLSMRLGEGRAQAQAVLCGVSNIVPTEQFNLWSWEMLEIKVCGTPMIDLQLLRKNTKYDGRYGEKHQTIHHFWEAMDTLSQEDLRLFLKFVWGRTRLPPDGSLKWGEGMKISEYTDYNYRSVEEQRRPVDGILPRAHTCFFQLDLPMYTTYDSLLDRLTFAIRNCITVSMA